MAPIVENGLTLKPYMSERRVSIVGPLLVAVGPVGMSVFIPAMPDVVRAMNTTETFANLTLTLYFAGFAFAMLIVGPLSDALGRKPITLAFTLLFCSASLLALLAPTIEVLILAR